MQFPGVVLISMKIHSCFCRARVVQWKSAELGVIKTVSSSSAGCLKRACVLGKATLNINCFVDLSDIR